MSGDGQSRLKNCPGLTASALGEASTIMCLYSEFTQSCATIGASDSSAGMCVSSGAGDPVPTTKGADANGWCIRDPFSHDLLAWMILLEASCTKIKKITKL